MALNWPLKFSMAWERSWWKRRRTSTPPSVCGYAPRPQHGAVNRGRVPGVAPRLQHAEQLLAQTGDLPRQRVGDGRQAPFPGPSGGELALLGEYGPELDHGGGRLVQHAEQGMHARDAAQE